MPDVLQITGSDFGGGAETVVRKHHFELIHREHNAHLLVGRKKSDLPNVSEIPFQRGPKGLLRLTRWIQQESGLQNLYSPSFRAVENAFPFRPEVLHLHSLHGVDSFAELRVANRLSQRYPTVVSLHDLWLMTGHCGHPLSCPKWTTGCGGCPDLTLYPAVKRDATAWNFRRKRNVFRTANVHLVTPSRWLQQQVEKSPILGHLPVTVIGNPVDTHTFRPSPTCRAELRSQLGIAPDVVLVLMVAQHLNNPYKGIQDGLDVLDQLSSHNFHVLLVGDGSDKLSQNLRVPSQTLPYLSTTEELSQCYNAADILLMPSRGETFGLVAAEAMACGTPVAAFQVGGLPEVIGDSTTGILSQPGEKQQLAEKIDDLVRTPERIELMSRNARLRIESNFDLKHHTDQMLFLYQQVIDDRAAA